MLAVVLFAILGVVSILSTGKNGVKSNGVDAAKNELASTNEEPSAFDDASPQDLPQDQREPRRRSRQVVPSRDTRQEEVESGSKETFRFKESEFFGESDGDASETTEATTDFEEWTEDREGYESDEPAPVRSTSIEYSLTPFEGDITSVSADYLGHDLSEIVGSLRRYAFQLPNDSPRSQKWLQQREEFLREEHLYGSLSFGSRFAYVMKNASENDVNLKETVKVDYQEATKTMTVRRSFKFSHKDAELAERLKDRVFVYFTLFVKNNYAYGLSFQCQKRSNPQFDCWTLTNVSPEDYVRLKNSIRVLCVFQLSARGGSLGRSYSGFSGPFRGAARSSYYYDSYESDQAFAYPFYAVSAENTEFWLYDAKTGAILAKYSEDDFFKGRRFALPKTSRYFGDSSSIDLGLTPKPTWREVLREAVEPEESWETKKPSITIPDDAESLEDALAKSHDGDVILVRAIERPIPLRSKNISHGDSSEILCDKEVAVVGESSDPKDVTIEIPSDATLKIDLPGFVAFKGVTFATTPPTSGKTAAPSVVVSGRATGRFRDCRFVGAKKSESIGAAVVGEYAAAEFWRCKFSEFEVDGLRVEDSAKATLEYCEFILGNRHGVSALNLSSVKVDRCRFDGNITGFIAEGGGGVVVSNSFFSRNSSNWSISSGSARACDTKEGNVVEK